MVEFLEWNLGEDVRVCSTIVQGRLCEREWKVFLGGMGLYWYGR